MWKYFSVCVCVEVLLVKRSLSYNMVYSFNHLSEKINDKNKKKCGYSNTFLWLYSVLMKSFVTGEFSVNKKMTMQGSVMVVSHLYVNFIYLYRKIVIYICGLSVRCKCIHLSTNKFV